LSRRARGWCLPSLTVTLVAGLLAGSLATAAPASASPAPTAADDAAVLLGKIRALQTQTNAALQRYETAMTQVGTGVTASRQATAADRAAEGSAEQAQRVLDKQILALYVSGGRAGLYSSMISSDGLEGFTHRAVLLQRLSSGGRQTATAAAKAASAARTAAEDARNQATASIKTAGQIGTALAHLDALLAQQQRLLAAANASRATAVAAAALLAAKAAAAQITAGAGRRVGPMPGSPAYFRLYHAASATCTGLSWTVLAAIGQVETGHGRNMNTSSVGAQGPMQFMPRTFAAYGVDGDRDGRIDIRNPADAIFSAAHYLCANRAGTGPAGLRQAVWHYNHANWYVDMVLALAARYAGAAKDAS